MHTSGCARGTFRPEWPSILFQTACDAENGQSALPATSALRDRSGLVERIPVAEHDD